jgi:cellulose synthase/poly-beta-1,6-N-acetylglucosamine synthase-like glycosyltransferase
MELGGLTWQDLLFCLLVLWTTRGLLLLHLGVLGARAVYRAGRRLWPRCPPHPPSGPPENPSSAFSLSFIVPVYNDALTVGPCLESLLAQSVPPHAIVIVNDGSTDATRYVLDLFRARGVTVVHLPDNRGKTRALEAGLHSVHTDLVAFTDADSLVDPHYVREIRASFRDPAVVAAAGAVESLPQTWVTAARQVEYLLSIYVHRNAETHLNTMWVLPGVSTTYRRQVLLELGFEHDTIGEDLDLTWRLHRAGRKMVMNLRAKVYTADPPTLRAYYRQLTRWYTDVWLCVKKHRALVGRGAFGWVGLPLAVLNTFAASVVYLLLPLYLLLFASRTLGLTALTELACNATLAVLAHWLYRRRDVYWSLLSSYPTRIITRFVILLTFVRVLIGRPDLVWRKIERLHLAWDRPEHGQGRKDREKRKRERVRYPWAGSFP